MSATPFLPAGSIVGIDHRTFPCPPRVAESVREFWRNLGIKPHHREEKTAIDELDAGTRIDLYIGAQTITYAVGSRGTILDDTDPNEGHLGLKVTPEAIRLLIDHPRVERSRGNRGLVRWGTHDFSVTLRDPAGNRIEFRCSSAPHSLADLLD